MINHFLVAHLETRNLQNIYFQQDEAVSNYDSNIIQATKE